MTINVNDVRDLVQELDGVMAVADASMPTLVIDVLRIRRAYNLGRPPALSTYARAIERVEDGDTSDLSSELIIAAAALCKAELAPRLAEAAIANDVTDVPRLAALLAIHDLERLEQLLAHSHGEELVISTTEAYLALVDARRAIPPELERRWSAVEHAAHPTGEHYSARLRLAARRDPVAAMTLLGEAIVEVGVNDVSSGVAAVMTRAVRVDRTHAWSFMRAERPCEARAFILEALVRGEPDAHELEPMLVDVIAQWSDRGWGSDRSPIGAMGMVMPLLATCATAGRLDLAATVRDTFGPSRFMIRWATAVETRRRFLRNSTWNPGEWDQLAPIDYQAGLAGETAMQIPQLTNEQLAAWWKLATLPIETLAWPGTSDATAP